MVEFVNENIGSIIVAVVFLLIVAVLYFAAKGKYRKVAKQIMLSLVVAAEEKYGSGTGKIKFSYVVDRLYEKLPVIVQVVFSEKDIENMIEDAVAKMKEFLEDNTETSLTETEKEHS